MNPMQLLDNMVDCQVGQHQINLAIGLAYFGSTSPCHLYATEIMVHSEDYQQLAIGMKIYDALYSWAKYVQEEKHTWNPQL